MYSRFKTLTTSLLALLVLLTLALPAAARQSDFKVTPAQLQAPFAEYAAAGFSLNFELAVERASVSLGDGTVILDVVVLGIDQASPLLVKAVVAPVVAGGVVSWRYVDATFNDGAGNPVDLPQEQMRALFQTSQTAWALAFEDSVRTAREKGSAASGQSFVDIVVNKDDVIQVMVSNVAPSRSGGAEGKQSITITQEQMNRALAALVERIDGVDSMTVEIAGEQLRYTVGVIDDSGQSQALLVTFVRNPNLVSDNDFDDFVGARGSNALYAADSIVLKTGKAAVEALAQRAEQAVIRATNHYLSMQVDMSRVDSLIIFIGSFEVVLGGLGNDTVRGGGYERIELTADDFNSAFAVMVANDERIDSLKVEFSAGEMRFSLHTSLVLNYEEIKWIWRIDPDSWSWGASNSSGLMNLPKPQNLTCCGGQTPDPSVEGQLQFEIQDLMSRFFPWVIRHAAGDRQIIDSEFDVEHSVVIIIVG